MSTPRDIRSLPVLRIRWQQQFSKCNLKCPYCIAEWTKHDVSFDPDKFRRIIDKLLDLPYRLVIRLGVGGEFFLSDDLQDGVVSLSHHPKVEGISFSTNLVVGEERIQSFLDRTNIERLGMGITLHDTQIKDIDGFFDKVQRVQDRGVLVYVGYVGLPDRFDEIKAYKQRLDGMGVPFILNEYNGSTQNAPYPAAYTSEERSFLRQHFFSEHYYRMLVERESPQGQGCLAGHRYIYLNNKGQVFNCGMDRNQEWEMEWNGLQKLAARFNPDWAKNMQTKRVLKNSPGNILDPEFHLTVKASPRVCPYTACTCGNEVQAMKSVGNEYYRTRTLRVIYPKNRKSEFEARYPNLRPLENDLD